MAAVATAQAALEAERARSARLEEEQAEAARLLETVREELKAKDANCHSLTEDLVETAARERGLEAQLTQARELPYPYPYPYPEPEP